MSQVSNAPASQYRRSEASSAPAAVGYVVAGAVAALLGGAVYLIAVRGEALIVDLGKLGRIFCF